MIKRIYFDLDGVLNEMTTYFLNRLGCPIQVHDFNSYPHEVGFNIVEAANILGPKTWTAEEFWQTPTREWWASVPESKECRWLLGHAEALVGQKNIFILTSPTRCPDSLAGKLEWIHQYCPKWLHRQFLMGPPKDVCARPDALLIDDADHNVDAFRAAGGHALLVPRPWNTRRNYYHQHWPVNPFHSLFRVRNFGL